MKTNDGQILLTLGGMRAPIDDVRFIANESTGATGMALAEKLHQLHIQARVICGWTPDRVHETLRSTTKHEIVYTPSFEEMRAAVRATQARYAVFAAAVLDFIPDVVKGKIDSRGDIVSLRMRPTPKIVDEFCKEYPDAMCATFKLEAGLTDSELVKRALETNAHRKPAVVVANHLSRVSPQSYEGFVIIPDWKLGKALEIISVKSRLELANQLIEKVLNVKVSHPESCS